MSEPYENTLSAAQLRSEVRNAWDMSLALNMALLDLPAVPPVTALRALTHAAMNLREPDVMKLGKQLQREHGLDVVPPKTEYECAAGLWSIIRAGIIAARTNT